MSTCCVGDLLARGDIEISKVRTVPTEALRRLVADLRTLVQYQLVDVTTVS